MSRAERHARRHVRFRRWWTRSVLAGVTVSVVAGGVGAARGAGHHAAAVRAAVARPITIGAAHGASYVPALRGKKPLFILVIGSDQRPGLGGRRADSIHIIGIDPRLQRATILGFPRDSWVSIPGHGTDKINAALELGGPSLLVRTVESVTGIRLDFWMLTTFKGFKKMVNGIGGLTIDVPYRMEDSYSGSNFRPGPRKMNGKQALAFARDRHSTPNGDISRSWNQGQVLLSALSKLGDRFAKEPTTVFDWMAVGWGQIDTDLSVATMLDLALTAAQMSPKHVNNMVAPASVGMVGGASVVFLSPSAGSLYADMKREGVIGARGR